MDFVIEVEIQFPVKNVCGHYVDLHSPMQKPDKSDAKEYAKQSLGKLIEMGLLSHYHILGEAREVESD